MILALVGVSTPGFWLGLMLLTHVALKVDFAHVWTGWFHLRRSLDIDHPAAGGCAVGRIETCPAASCKYRYRHDGHYYPFDPFQHAGGLRKDYIRTAKAKGLNNQVVVLKHALRNALFAGDHHHRHSVWGNAGRCGGDGDCSLPGRG